MKAIAMITLAFISAFSVGPENGYFASDCSRDPEISTDLCWAERFFRTQYQPAEYSKFTGKVSYHDSTFTFGQDELEVRSTNPDLLLIFKQGLLHPEVIAGSWASRRESVHIAISNVKEVRIPNTTPGAKRFTFVLWSRVLTGETIAEVCFIELTSDQNSHNLKSFIEHSRLTFYKRAWMMM